MNVGKSLRLRRIFGRGSALIVDTPALEPDPVGNARRLAHTGVDAVILTPGLLETVAEDLGDLAVILRLARIEDVLHAGADAAITSGPELPDVASEARCRGIPVFVTMRGACSVEAVWNAVHVGADVLCLEARYAGGAADVARAAKRAVLAEISDAADLVNQAYELMQLPVQGLVLRDAGLTDTGALDALHALVHQGVSVMEATAVLRRSRTATQGNRG